MKIGGSVKPYYENEYGVLYKGDCLEIMPTLDTKVDLVLTDPPFGTIASSWDSTIPAKEMWKNLSILGQREANFLLFGNEPFSTHTRYSNLNEYKYDLIWVKNKSTGFQHAKNMPLKQFENIMVFSQRAMGHANLLGARRMTYNPQGLVRIDKMVKCGASKFGNIAGKRPSHKEEVLREFTNYPNNILHYDKDGTLHPTQKPVALLEYLIRTYSTENELVLDFTAGSSSTAIACMNTNRKFIMIEKEEKYCEISAKRMEEHLNKMKIEFEDI